MRSGHAPDSGVTLNPCHGCHHTGTSAQPICCTTPPQIDYARGVDSTVAQFMAFQKALPTLDKRFGLTYGLGQAKFNLNVSGLLCFPLRLSSEEGVLPGRSCGRLGAAAAGPSYAACKQHASVHTDGPGEAACLSRYAAC